VRRAVPNELGEEQGRRVGHRLQPVLLHLEDADLVGRAESVLHRAQDAERMAAVTFEVQHGVDHVLEHAGAGEGAFLGHVADQDAGQTMALGELDDQGGALAHLPDAARRRGEVLGEHRLDRVDGQHHRLHRLRVIEHRLHRGLGQHQ
jgi:hypothetical protein